MKSNQSTFRESVEKILNKTITRETHKGTVNRVRFQVVEAITLAHEEEVKKELETIKGLTVRYIEYAGNKIVLAINPDTIEDRIRELSNE